MKKSASGTALTSFSAGLAATVLALGAAAGGCGGGSASDGALASATPGSTAAPTTTATAGTPTVSAVAPAMIWNDRSAALVIQGLNFAAPAQVRLIDPSGAATFASSVVVRSAVEVEATFAPGLAPGVCQVVVETAAGPPSSVGPTVTVVGNVDPDVTGGHHVGWRDVQLQGASGDRPAMRIYYPATTAGPGAPADLSRAPYPIVAYGHGFRPPLLSFGVDFRNNAFVAAWLVSSGYVVACPDLSTNNQLFGASGRVGSRPLRTAEGVGFGVGVVVGATRVHTSRRSALDVAASRQVARSPPLVAGTSVTASRRPPPAPASAPASPGAPSDTAKVSAPADMEASASTPTAPSRWTRTR